MKAQYNTKLEVQYNMIYKGYTNADYINAHKFFRNRT